MMSRLLQSLNVLFRASDPKERKKYVELVEAVRNKGAEVLIFSSMHESGQRKCSRAALAPILSSLP